MQHAHIFEAGFQDGAMIVDSLVAKDGSATHPHVQALQSATTTPTSQPLPLLADVAHYLGLLYGKFPSVMEYAATHITDNAARKWLIDTCDAFTEERAFLARLAVELGPVPSTSNHSSSDATVLQLRHTLEMLSQSERRGCSLGAATTLALDWATIRRLLDQAAIRIGLEPFLSAMPDRNTTLAVLRNLNGDDLMMRAIRFGGRQLLHQHHSLWTMLQQRAGARAGR